MPVLGCNLHSAFPKVVNIRVRVENAPVFEPQIVQAVLDKILREVRLELESRLSNICHDKISDSEGVLFRDCTILDEKLFLREVRHIIRSVFESWKRIVDECFVPSVKRLVDEHFSKLKLGGDKKRRTVEVVHVSELSLGSQVQEVRTVLLSVSLV